jgi:phenylacetate-CoA ligase
MTPANLASYAAELQRRRLPWLHGYPSAIAILAAHILDSGFELGYRIQWVTVAAENLLPHQAEVIEQAFGVAPRQHYGMAEAAANISQCEFGTLHVDEDFSTVEFVENVDGPGHRIVGTNFTNFATPLLRYDVQDLVSLTDNPCPCARPGRVVSSLDGRAEDYVFTRDGTRVGPMNHIFKDMVNVREAQIYQPDLARISLRVVRRPDYGKSDEDALLRETHRRVGEDTTVEIDYVDSLPRSSSGKLRVVVSEVRSPTV